VTNIQSYR